MFIKFSLFLTSMKYFLEKDNAHFEEEISKEISIKEFLKKKDISNESVILIKNGEIVLEDEILNNLDELKILSVVSGG